VKALLGVVATVAAASAAALGQLPGAAGCLNRSGSSSCAAARAVANPLAVAASRDGKSLYATGGIGSLGRVGVFARDPATGKLRQLAGRAGCLSRVPSRACRTGRGLETPAAVAVSPDGRRVAIAGRNGRSIGLYRRNASGALTATGCFQTQATPGCRETAGLQHVSALAFSPNGEVLGAGSRAGLVSFTYDAGSLSFAEFVPTKGAVALAFTRDSASLYAVGGGGERGWMDVFELDTDGQMNRIQCVEQGEPAGCQAANGLQQPVGVAVSQDGRHVYVASSVSAAVDVFERNETGAVAPPQVVKNPALAGATGMAVRGDRVYVTSRKIVTELRRSGSSLRVAGSFRPRGVSDLRAVIAAGRNVYVAGHGIAVLRIS
jgi:6-phosphogluconolactonase (cycloisomerase 2 family)